MLSFSSILVAVCALFFYRAGEFENASGIAWAELSIAVSVAMWQWLGGGFLAVLGGQVALFAAITAYRARRANRS